MTEQTGVRKILNDVIDGDSIIEHYNIDTVANMYPGAVVTRSTTDFDIKVTTGNEDAVGWLGYGACIGTDKPATRDTIYLDDANAPVHSGMGFYVRARCASASFTKGAELTCDSSGNVAAGTIGSHQIVATAAETVSSVDHVWVLSRI